MLHPFALQYAPLSSDSRSSRRYRLRLERLEDIAAANSLQDLLLAGFLDTGDAAGGVIDADPLKSLDALVAGPTLSVATAAASVESPPESAEFLATDLPPSDDSAPVFEAPADPVDAGLEFPRAITPVTPGPVGMGVGADGGPGGGMVSAGPGSGTAPVAVGGNAVFAAAADGADVVAPSLAAHADEDVAAPPAKTGPGDRVSVRSAVGEATIQLDAHGHRLAGVFAAPVPTVQVQTANLPYGLIGFQVTGVRPGGLATVDMTLPAGAQFDGYYKQDPRTGAIGQFDFDGQTGAVVRGNTITLYLRDGGRGDDDGLVNGVVVDPGGPGEWGSFPVVASALVREVTFSGPDLITISADPGTPAYEAPPQWLDSDGNGSIDAPGDRALPIGYPRGTDIIVSARFTADVVNFPTLPPDYHLMVQGQNFTAMTQAATFAIPPTTVTLDGNELYLPPTVGIRGFPNCVNYGNLGINWMFSKDGGLTWTGAGVTTNELYVTLDAPEATPVYHSIIHISAPASAIVAAASAAVAVTETMNAFKSRNVKTRHINPALNNRPVHYYKNWDTTNINVGDLLSDPKLDGQCSAWAEAFAKAVRNLGIKPATNPMNLHVIKPTSDQYFLVENWSIEGEGSSNDPNHPYVNTFANPAEVKFMRQNAQDEWEYYWGAAEIDDRPGLPGQNTANPKSLFEVHVLVEIGGKYFDPSYGTGPFDTLKAWEDLSVAAFAKLDFVAANNFRMILRRNLGEADMELLGPALPR